MKFKSYPSYAVTLLATFFSSCVTLESPGAMISSHLEIEDLIDTYQECYMARETINFLPDSTFEIRLSGDLFPGEKARGSVSIQPDGVIVLNGNPQLVISETTSDLGEKFRVRLLDHRGITSMDFKL